MGGYEEVEGFACCGYSRKSGCEDVWRCLLSFVYVIDVIIGGGGAGVHRGVRVSSDRGHCNTVSRIEG